MSIHLSFKSLADYIRIAEAKLEAGELYLHENEDPEVLSKRLKRRKSYLSPYSFTGLLHILMWYFVFEGGDSFVMTPLNILLYNAYLIFTMVVVYFIMKSYMMIEPKEEEGYSLTFLVHVATSTTGMVLLAHLLLGEFTFYWLHFALYIVFLLELFFFCLFIDIIKNKLARRN